MNTRAVALALVAGSVMVGSVMVLAGGAPAVAVTQLTTTTDPVVAAFGEPWMLELELTATESDYYPPISESSGRVDVFIEQVPGTFLENLTVQANGRVFVTQPPGSPWLAPGTYDLRAVFTPAASTGLQTAQLRVPAAITITPIELNATVAVETGAAAVTVPTVTLSMAGPEELASLPPGVWSLSVREASGTDTLLSRQVVQTTALEPIVIELAGDLRPGVDHVLLAEFAPVAEYAPGVVVSGTGEIPFRTAAQDLGQWLVTPIDVPIWALVLALVGLAAGVAGLVTALIVRARRRSSTVPTESAADSTAAEASAGDASAADESESEAPNDTATASDESPGSTATTAP